LVWYISCSKHKMLTVRAWQDYRHDQWYSYGWQFWTISQLCSWYSKFRKRYSFLILWGKFKLCKIYYKMTGPKELHVKFLSKIHLTCVWEEHTRLTTDETVTISVEARQFPNLSSELIFAENVLAKIQLSSLTYGIVNIDQHITYISNEVLTSRHDCVFERYTCELDLPKKLPGCTLYTRYCSVYPKKTCPFYILYCTNNLFVYLEKLNVAANYAWRRGLQV